MAGEETLFWQSPWDSKGFPGTLFCEPSQLNHTQFPEDMFKQTAYNSNSIDEI